MPRLRGAYASAAHISKVTMRWRIDESSAAGVLWRLWAWQLWRRTVRRPVTIRCAEGSLLLAPPWSRMASHVAATGLTEPREALFVLDLLRPTDLFVDVGANIGFYTALAGRRGARVLAFEPSPDTHEICRRNIALNDLGAAVVLREAACGAVAGRAGFSSGLDITNHIVADEDADLDVQLSTLDEELAAEHDGFSMLKLDAEGHDLDVLHGALDAVTRLLPVIMVEVWAGGVEERLLLEPLGYRAYGYRPADRTLEPIAPDFTGQANFLFINSARHEAVSERLRTANRPRLSAPAIRWRAPRASRA